MTHPGSPLIIHPDQYITFKFTTAKTLEHKYVGGGVIVYATDIDCPTRLSKYNSHVYYGRKMKNGTYELLDDAKTNSNINRVGYSLWPNKDKERYLKTFLTQDFQNRYPIVGPFVISELVWEPPTGLSQYVKVTCVYGNFGTSFNGTGRTASWLNEGLKKGYNLRFEQQKDLYSDTATTVITNYNGPKTVPAIAPPAFEIPILLLFKAGTSFYITNATPAKFIQDYSKTIPGLSTSNVFGPWVGAMQNKTSGRVYVSLAIQDSTPGVWLVEEIDWKPAKPNKTTYYRPAANGGITRLSLTSVASEPDNWIGIGQKLNCNLSAEFPQTECPTIDKCTASLCVNESGVGVCKYSALVCNHPNWDICYPKSVCLEPYKLRNRTKDYRFGCNLSTIIFGHHWLDTVTFGFYPKPGCGVGYPSNLVITLADVQANYACLAQDTKWYDVGCVRQPVDCEVSKWSEWTRCMSCQDKNANQTRTRHIKLMPSKNPNGKACPPLIETRTCENIDTSCGPTNAPTLQPTRAPTPPPTYQPTTSRPTTGAPTRKGQPTVKPPVNEPTTFEPTTSKPTTSAPTGPTNKPTPSPTQKPTNAPSKAPTSKPTNPVSPALAPINKELLYRSSRNNNYYYSLTGIQKEFSFSFTRPLTNASHAGTGVLTFEIPDSGMIDTCVVHTQPFNKEFFGVSLATTRIIWSNFNIATQFDSVQYLGYAFKHFFYAGRSLTSQKFRLFAVDVFNGKLDYVSKDIADNILSSSPETYCLSENTESIFIINKGSSSMFSITYFPDTNKVKTTFIWSNNLIPKNRPLKCAVMDESTFVYVGIDASGTTRLNAMSLDGQLIWVGEFLNPGNELDPYVSAPSVFTDGTSYVGGNNTLYKINPFGEGVRIPVEGKGSSFDSFIIDQDGNAFTHNNVTLTSTSKGFNGINDFVGYGHPVVHEDREVIVSFKEDGLSCKLWDLRGNFIRDCSKSWFTRSPPNSVLLDQAFFPDSLVLLYSSVNKQLVETLTIIGVPLNLGDDF